MGVFDAGISGEMKMKTVLAVALCAALGAGCASMGSMNVYRNDLNEDKVSAVRIGESAESLKTRLGEPYQRVHFEFLRSTAWDYRYKDLFGFWTDISFMIDGDNRVKEVIRSRIQGGKDDK
jgi:outer membrane protein assembly factor BamE (lipoprotein component of BamABCDE complex)